MPKKIFTIIHLLFASILVYGQTHFGLGVVGKVTRLKLLRNQLPIEYDQKIISLPSPCIEGSLEVKMKNNYRINLSADFTRYKIHFNFDENIIIDDESHYSIYGLKLITGAIGIEKVANKQKFGLGVNFSNRSNFYMKVGGNNSRFKLGPKNITYIGIRIFYIYKLKYFNFETYLTNDIFKSNNNGINGWNPIQTLGIGLTKDFILIRLNKKNKLYCPSFKQ